MITLSFDFKPRPWQDECISKQTRFTVLALHRRAGKTTLALAELVLYALQQPGIYGYICPQLNQAERNAWKPLKEMLSQLGTARVSQKNRATVTVYESRKMVEFINGSQIILLGADDPDNLRGLKFAGCVLDEVAQMPREAWTEVVMPALADSNGWALFIGTPKGENLFSELFRQGQNKSFQPEWSSRAYTIYDTGVFDERQIAQFKRDMSEDEFKREYLCDFAAQSYDQLIPAKDVEEAMRRRYDPGTFNSFKKVAGVDVARYGDDSSVVFIRQGKQAFTPHVFKGLSLVELAQRVMAIVKKENVRIIYCDGTGVGGGVVDVLRAWGADVYDIAFGQKAIDPCYYNKRTEMWYQMAQWLKQASIPKETQLFKDLTAPIYERDENGTVRLESKKLIKKRLGYSPDLADALALTFGGFEDDAPRERTPESLEELLMYQQRGSTPNDRFKRQIRGPAYPAHAAFQSGLGRKWR